MVRITSWSKLLDFTLHVLQYTIEALFCSKLKNLIFVGISTGMLVCEDMRSYADLAHCRVPMQPEIDKLAVNLSISGWTSYNGQSQCMITYLGCVYSLDWTTGLQDHAHLFCYCWFKPIKNEIALKVQEPLPSVQY